ncbi:MAG: hypothetical protein VCD00_19750, partial [Candidatus Hydrogenedentota bacterium]
MSQNSVTYWTTFPGGLASVDALRAIAELSMARGDGKLRLSSRQQLELQLPVGADISTRLDLQLLGAETDSGSVPMSTAGVVDIHKGYDWLSLGAFQEMLDGFPKALHYSVGISDTAQSYLPSHAGDLMFIA